MWICPSNEQGNRLFPNVHPKLRVGNHILGVRARSHGKRESHEEVSVLFTGVVRDGRSLIPDKDVPVVLTGTCAVRSGVLAKFGPLQKVGDALYLGCSEVLCIVIAAVQEC